MKYNFEGKEYDVPELEEGKELMCCGNAYCPSAKESCDNCICSIEEQNLKALLHYHKYHDLVKEEKKLKRVNFGTKIIKVNEEGIEKILEMIKELECKQNEIIERLNEL